VTAFCFLAAATTITTAAAAALLSYLHDPFVIL
jgi:hypothetical protein